jgi:hypothetical protein
VALKNLNVSSEQSQKDKISYLSRCTSDAMEPSVRTANGTVPVLTETGVRAAEGARGSAIPGRANGAGIGDCQEGSGGREEESFKGRHGAKQSCVCGEDGSFLSSTDRASFICLVVGAVSLTRMGIQSKCWSLPIRFGRFALSALDA